MLLHVGPLRRAEQRQELVCRGQAGAHQLRGALHVAEITDADAAPAVFVLVGRADPPAGGADLLALLPGPIEQLMVRQGEVRAVRHVELVVAPDPALGQGVELLEERLRVEDHAVAHDADGALDDARRDLVQHELARPGVHGVAGVGAPLVAHHEIGALGEHVDDLPLALVAPLGADDDNAVCFRPEHGAPTKTPLARGA